ncbi:MAG: S1 family peptidase [Caulobacteraceae bacterium]
MRLPRLPRIPDWLMFVAIVAILVFIATGRRERADAPPAPPPLTGAAGAALPPASPFDPSEVVRSEAALGPEKGTAFSVGEAGVWITARHVIERCRKIAIVIAEGRGVAAQAYIDPASEAAVLITKGGTPGLPLAGDAALRRGMRAFHPGFPRGAPGEVASRLIGRENLRLGGRRGRGEPVLAWAEAGRTAGLSGALGGISGAPALDGAGEVVGVTIAQAPRRGRLYTTTPHAIRAALTRAGVAPDTTSAAEPIAADTYGLAADDLRRALRIAQVVCLAE